VRGYRDAITYASTLDGIAPDRIGIWGTSLSGGHVLVVAAVDWRVRAVVSQVPASNIHDTQRRLIPAYAWNNLMSGLQADREDRYPDKPSAIIPVASADPSAPCALPGIETYEWLMRNAATAPAWRNEITVASLDMLMEYTPEAFIARIAPTPLFMTLADGDTLTPTEIQLETYQRALEPKQLQMLHGPHHTVYEDSFNEASRAQTEFLLRHLAR
jgi:acetyl esterase/lipase